MTLKELLKNSYTPYSGKSSCAVVKSKQGNCFPGVRVENISFPLTISAAQNALYCCLSEGHEPNLLFLEGEPNDTPDLAYWREENSLTVKNTDEAEEVSFYEIFQKPRQESISSILQKRLERSIVPYSNFPVAAVLETNLGYITGINIETEDWSKGLCAERVALAKALTYGVKEINALHITTRDGEYNSPCGACRQVIAEHMPHHPVFLHHKDGTTAEHFSSDLLPYSFQSRTLKKE